MIAFMIRLALFLVCIALLHFGSARAAPTDYAITVTTAFAQGDPFPNRIDSAFTETSTGYFQIQNTGGAVFSGTVGTIAVSAFAGDLSFTSGDIVLAPGASVSIAIPDNSSVVGGFNGPAYFFRPGVEITLNGVMSAGPLAQAVALLVADADIHSGVARTDGFGLTSDSFVLQGGDPWGFQTADAFALSQAPGVAVLAGALAAPVLAPGPPPVLATETVPEPGSASILVSGLVIAAISRRRLVRSPAV